MIQKVLTIRQIIMQLDRVAKQIQEEHKEHTAASVYWVRIQDDGQYITQDKIICFRHDMHWCFSERKQSIVDQLQNASHTIC